jgi:hypothetical protein
MEPWAKPVRISRRFAQPLRKNASNLLITRILMETQGVKLGRKLPSIVPLKSVRRFDLGKAPETRPLSVALRYKDCT